MDATGKGRKLFYKPHARYWPEEAPNSPSNAGGGSGNDRRRGDSEQPSRFLSGIRAASIQVVAEAGARSSVEGGTDVAARSAEALPLATERGTEDGDVGLSVESEDGGQVQNHVGEVTASSTAADGVVSSSAQVAAATRTAAAASAAAAPAERAGTESSADALSGLGATLTGLGAERSAAMLLQRIARGWNARGQQSQTTTGGGAERRGGGGEGEDSEMSAKPAAPFLWTKDDMRSSLQKMFKERDFDRALAMNSSWTRSMDSELVTLVTLRAEGAKVDAVALDPRTLELSEDEKIAFPLLSAVLDDRSAVGGIDSIRLRFAILRLLNARLERVILLVNLMSQTSPWTVGYKLHSLAKYIFIETKRRIMDCAIQQSQSSRHSGISFQIDNAAAFAGRERAEHSAKARDPAVSRCHFAQGFHHLQDKSPASLRGPLDQRGRLFEVGLKGEAGMDWGGIYRDFLDKMVDDLFSSHLALNLPSPNTVARVGNNTDRFIPNPAQSSPLVLRMFEFVGKLMGIAIRTKNYLVFKYAPMIWKLIAGHHASLVEADLATVDSVFVRHIRSVRESSATTEVEFAKAFPMLTFSVSSAAPVGENDSGDLKGTASGIRSASSGLSEKARVRVGISKSSKSSSDVSSSRGVEKERHGGNSGRHDLIPNGSQQSVTLVNRERWCELAVRSRLHEFDAATTAIRKGLCTVRVDAFLSWRNGSGSVFLRTQPLPSLHC